jgi:ankyrin repeat protein
VITRLYILLLALAVSSLSTTAAPSTEAASPADELRKLLQGKELRLSSTGPSASGHFSARFDDPDSDLLGSIESNGNRQALLMRDRASGLPLSYSSNGFALAFSSHHPGRLELIVGTDPEVVIKEDAATLSPISGGNLLGQSARFDFSFLAQAINTALEQNNPITKSTAENSLPVYNIYFQPTRRLRLQINPESPFPITALRFENRKGEGLNLTDIRVNTPPARPLTNLTRRDLTQAGLFYNVHHATTKLDGDLENQSLSDRQSRQVMDASKPMLLRFAQSFSPPKTPARIAAATKFLELLPLAKTQSRDNPADFNPPDDPWPAPSDNPGSSPPHSQSPHFPKDAITSIVPFENTGSLFLVKPLIDDHPLGHFLIDSGATNSILSIDIADRLQLHWQRNLGEAIQESGGTQELAWRKINSLQLGDLTFPMEKIGTADLTAMRTLVPDIDGIIGNDILRHVPFTIDYQANTLTFHQPRSFQPPPDSRPLEITISNTRPTVPVQLFDAPPFCCAIDTGMESALDLPEKFITKHAKYFDPLRAWRTSVVGPSLQAEKTRRLIPPGKITLLGTSLDRALDADPSTSPGARAENRGTVGGEILSQFRLTFDYSNKTLHVEDIPAPPIPRKSKLNKPDLRGYTPLDIAAFNGDRDRFQALLDAGADFRKSNPLLHAINSGDPALVTLILQKGADPDMKNGSPLAAAARSGQADLVNILLDGCADPNLNHGAAILQAVAHNETKITRLLLDAGAPTKVGAPPPISLLLVPVSQGHLDTVRLLLNRGLDPNTQLQSGKPLFWVAVANRHPEVADLLIEHGADLTFQSPDNQTLLHLAASSGDHQTLRHALEKDAAHIHTMDSLGVTPLHHAAQQGHLKALNLLLEHGAHPNARTATKGATALHLAAENNRLEIARALLESPQAESLNIDAPTGMGYTPLHSAARAGRSELVELLLEHGADPNARDPAGTTPIFVAATVNAARLIDQAKQFDAPGNVDSLKNLQDQSFDYPGVIKALAQAGANLTIHPFTGTHIIEFLAADWRLNPVTARLLQLSPNFGRDLDLNKINPAMYAANLGNTEIIKTFLAHDTPITPTNPSLPAPSLVAALSGQPQALEILLENGADPNLVHPSGESALHVAVEHDDPHLIETLIRAGANPNLKNRDGNTPLHIAVEKTRLNSVRTLLELGADPDAKNIVAMSPRALDQYAPHKKESLKNLFEEKIPAPAPSPAP